LIGIGFVKTMKKPSACTQVHHKMHLSLRAPKFSYRQLSGVRSEKVVKP